MADETFRDRVLDKLHEATPRNWSDIEIADAITKLHDDAVAEWRKALIRCAVNDRTPLYEYPGNCSTKTQIDKCRDQCGHLPKQGSRWQTPEEIARTMIGSDFDEMITTECHARALLQEDAAKGGKS